jgi:hypothetical protein
LNCPTSWATLMEPIFQVMVRGIHKVARLLVMAMALYNMVQLRTLARRASTRPGDQRAGVSSRNW